VSSSPIGDPGADLSDAALADWVRDIPDFPRPGVVYKDITPLLRQPAVLAEAVRRMSEDWPDVDLVCGIDARGFIFGALVAARLGVGFVPARKGGKLPWEVEAVGYSLEYGEEHLELHLDAVAPGQRVLVVDDVLATGGTARATAELVERLGGEVAGFSFLIELVFLGGRLLLPAEARVGSAIRVE
jgi:adenine phosphoribosyltransferase